MPSQAGKSDEFYMIYLSHALSRVVVCDAETGRVYNPNCVSFNRPDSPTEKYYGPFQSSRIVYFEYAGGEPNKYIDQAIAHLSREDAKRARMAHAYFEGDRMGCFDAALAFHREKQKPKAPENLQPVPLETLWQAIAAVASSGTGGIAPENSILAAFTEKNAARLLSAPIDRLAKRNTDALALG